MDRRVHIRSRDVQEVRSEKPLRGRSALNYITSRIGDIVFRGTDPSEILNMGHSIDLGREVDRVEV